MARKSSKHLTDVELRIMKVLWQRGETSVEMIQEDLAESGHPLAQPSIRTMLNILGKKKMVERRRDGRQFLYIPAVDRSAAEDEFVGDMVDRVFEGSASQLVAALLQRKDLQGDERERVRGMLRALEEDEKKT